MGWAKRKTIRPDADADSKSVKGLLVNENEREGSWGEDTSSGGLECTTNTHEM